MNEYQLERRYKILEDICGEKRNNYSINLREIFISIRNIKSGEGIYTDSLRKAKSWIIKDKEQ